MAGNSQVSVLVPVKPLHLAKQRLAPVLTPSERRQLAAAMLEDVIEACLAAGAFLDVALVTSDPAVIAIARRLDIAAIEEDAVNGVNAAIRTGRSNLPSPAAGIVVLPGDVPSVTAAALRRVAALCSTENTVVLIAASRDGGTNLLACSPLDLVEPSFGADSFARHRASARRLGIEPIQSLPGQPDLDLDHPEDLQSFIAMRTATHTHALLMDWAVPERLGTVLAGAVLHA